MSHQKGFFDKVELSAVLSVIGIIILFSTSIAVVLIAPGYVDRSWVEPTSPYQVLCYEVADPAVFISGTVVGGQDIQRVDHLRQGNSLIAFQETDSLKIKAPPELEKYVTKLGETPLKLTSRVLFLKQALDKTKEAGFETYELYDPKKESAFSIASNETVLENWIDKDFVVLDPVLAWHKQPGVIFVTNPREYLVSSFNSSGNQEWRIDPQGKPIASVEDLKKAPFGFYSRKELIELGEHIYAIEGCFYCHTDQTRTLVQDSVLNGSANYPAPPSSANEYIYQDITFPGTKRNGPDLSRTGIKRPSRDWHKSHFWSPKTESVGSIMPAYKHFFDFDPRGTYSGRSRPQRVPNYKFEAVFQYLMTKGTRITPPTQAWWLGRDPINVKEIIEGRGK